MNTILMGYQHSKESSSTDADRGNVKNLSLIHIPIRAYKFQHMYALAHTLTLEHPRVQQLHTYRGTHEQWPPSC